MNTSSIKHIFQMLVCWWDSEGMRLHADSNLEANSQLCSQSQFILTMNFCWNCVENEETSLVCPYFIKRSFPRALFSSLYWTRSRILIWKWLMVIVYKWLNISFQSLLVYFILCLQPLINWQFGRKRGETWKMSEKVKQLPTSFPRDQIRCGISWSGVIRVFLQRIIEGF